MGAKGPAVDFLCKRGEWRCLTLLGVTALDWFGVVSVSAMMLFYALEARGRYITLCFAFACLSSSAYGFLQGAWPFGIVEGVWTLVALNKWRQRPTLP